MRTEINEQVLLKGLVQNDRRCIETIYKRHYEMVQTLVVNNSGSADDAKDIFQEALIVLFEKARSGNFELNCQIKTYLYSVSKRIWLKKLLHHQKITPAAENLEEIVSVEEDMELYEQKHLDFENMELAMLNLGEPCKSLLESFYIQKKNMLEIASDFGYTNADNAKNQKYKCLMRLKKLFFDQNKKMK